MSSEADPIVVLITMDRKTESIVFARSDGKEARFPLKSSPFEASSVLSRVHLTPSMGALLAVTQHGDEILFELPNNDHHDQLRNRIVMYLDQNQWSFLSKALHKTGEASREEHEAANRIAAWVNHGFLILPASAAHYYETAKRFDTRKRYELGLTVLQSSRGWQMRDPLQVRRNEVHDGLCRRLSKLDSMRAEAVFTLEPNAIYSPLRGTQGYSASTNLPWAQAWAVKVLTAAATSIDSLLDTERIEPGPDTGWAASNQQFSDWLDEQGRDSQQKRKAIDALLVSDLRSVSSPRSRSWQECQLNSFPNGLRRISSEISANTRRWASSVKCCNTGI